MSELIQLYDEQGCAMAGKGGTKDDIFNKGLLHGAAHVWIWRQKDGEIEILLQKRASTKRTWPNLYDISAAGHIDLGEEPITAAMREAKEEIGLDIHGIDLRLIGIVRELLVTPTQEIENEFSWVYILQLKEDLSLNLRTIEVESVLWKDFKQFKTEVSRPETVKSYVPHTPHYFESVLYGLDSVKN